MILAAKSRGIMTPRHAEALRLAALGIPVLILRPGRKEPATKNGHKDRTTDPELINLWFDGPFDWNIGIIPEDQGLCVVDVDLPEIPPELPITETVKTPSGGFHLYYAGSLRPSVGKLMPGVDTRGEDSYVLVPPSIVDGKNYRQAAWGVEEYRPLPEWIVSKMETVEHEPRGEAPEHFDFVAASVQCRQVVERDLYIWGPPIEGEGSDARTVRFAARLLDILPDIDAVVSILGTTWAPHFTPDWLRTKVSNAAKYRENALGCDAPLPTSEKFAGAIAKLESWPEPIESEVVYGRKGIARRLQWLWEGWLPLGQLVLIAGDPKVGKSSIGFALMALLSQGADWPDGTKQDEAKRCLIWSSEDAWDIVIEPRLLTMHANLDLIDYVDGVWAEGKKVPFNPTLHMPALLRKVEKDHPHFIMIDNIADCVQGDDHHNNTVREALRPLIDMAARNGCVIFGVSHFKKNSEGQKTGDRVIGSVGYRALARVVLSAELDEITEQRTLYRRDSNLGPSQGAFPYQLIQAPTGLGWLAQRVEFGRYFVAKKEDDSATGIAARYIMKWLADGPMASTELKALCQEEGISWAHVNRAKRKMPRVWSYQDGTAHYWRLLLGADPW